MRKLFLIFLFLPLFANALTPIFTCGFECGQLGSVGQHWTTTGTNSISTTTFRTGLRALRVNPTAGNSYVTYLGGDNTFTIFRVAIKFVTLPSATTEIATLNFTANQYFGAYFNSSDSKIYAGVSTASLGATGVSVTTGVWYYVDVKYNISTNPILVDVQVNGSACGQASKLSVSGSATDITLGNRLTSTTADIFYDDFILSYTGADYPIGAGHVLAFVPASDGTHTSTTTHTVKGTAASPSGGGSITSATTDAFNWVNGRPIGGGATDATRLINAQTAASTEYVEFGIEQTTETTAPRSVEVLVIDQQATTAVGDMHIKVNDNGTETVVLDRTAVAGVITDRYTTKQFATMPTGGAAWTLVRFKALKIRFGYSSDATPDQYFRGAMVEAEFTDAVATVPGTPGDKRLSSTGVGFKP